MYSQIIFANVKLTKSEMADAVVKNECIVSIDTDQP